MDNSLTFKFPALMQSAHALLLEVGQSYTYDQNTREKNVNGYKITIMSLATMTCYRVKLPLEVNIEITTDAIRSLAKDNEYLMIALGDITAIPYTNSSTGAAISYRSDSIKEIVKVHMVTQTQR